MTPPLTSPAAARKAGRDRWDRVLRAWLIGEELPLRIPVQGASAPTSVVMANVHGYRDWIRSWEEQPHVSMRLVRKGPLGEIRVPAAVTPPTIDAYAEWIGAARDLALLRRRVDALSRFGCDRSGLSRVRSDLVEMGDEEFGHLLDLLTWRREFQEPTRARDVPLIGVGSKWVENRIGLIEPVLAACGLARDGADRFERCGLLRGSGAKLPLRFDPEDFPVLDLDCDPASFIRWPDRTHTLLILENEAPFRRLAPRPGYALAWGCGHAARATLPELSAATRIRLLYWGDCDSHGYAILNGLRGDLPDLRSVGMGIDTVLKSAGSLISEAVSERIEIVMPRLTDAEAAGRGHLMRNHARLEQERVPVDERDLFPEPTLA